MKKITKTIILILSLYLLSCKGNSKIASNTTTSKIGISKTAFPKQLGIINDYSHIFTESQRAELSKTLYDYAIRTTRQIAIVIVDSIKPYNDIQKYATSLGNTWGVGTSEKNNGLLLVICKPCRKIGIATGTGTAQVLTDEICKDIIDKTIIPEFKKGAYYKGTNKGVMGLVAKWK